MLGVYYQIEIGIVIFFPAFSPFNFYAVIKCFKTYSNKEVQFSVSIYHLAQRFVYFGHFVSGRRAPFNIL